MITISRVAPRATYENQRYEFLLLLEESGVPKLEAYADSKGIPTIGVGFNLRDTANQDAIFGALNLTGPLRIALGSVFRGQYPRQPGETQEQVNMRLRADINAEMARFGAGAFQFASATQVRLVFDQLVRAREDRVSNWAPNPILDSHERIALVSLAWNERSANPLLADKLYGALAAGNRAEAWFEIRYNSNLGGQSGVANRRYRESERFGLYDDVTNVPRLEAEQVLRMFANHRAQIERYESQRNPANANNAPIGEWLVAAERVAIAAYVLPEYGITIETGQKRVLVGNDQTMTHFGRDGQAAATFKAEDRLVGSAASDLLVGMGGDDRLEGGASADVLVGGRGFDTYVVEGADRIVDEDGQGRVLDNTGREISGTFVKRPDGSHEWLGNPAVRATQSSPLTLTLADGSSAVIEGFQSGQFGIRLMDALGAPTLVGEPFIGDLQGQDPGTPGVQVGFDAFGNVIASATPEPDRMDVLYDVLVGGLGKDTLQGGADDDRYVINAGESLAGAADVRAWGTT